MYHPFPQQGMGSHTDLVERIKMGQRTSHEWKMRWWNWCEANGGTKDPTKHEEWQLRQAVAQCGEPPVNGAPQSVYPQQHQHHHHHHHHHHQHHSYQHHHHHAAPHHAAPHRGRKRGPHSSNPVHASLVTAIKRGQRLSQEWKQGWWTWCDDQGAGVYDPSKHGLEALQDAIRKIGEPPAEGSAPTVPPPQPTSLEHEELIGKVKTLQRTQQAFKIAWGKYCDEHGEGKRDPSRHDVIFISKALEACIGGLRAAGMLPPEGAVMSVPQAHGSIPPSMLEANGAPQGYNNRGHPRR